MAGKVPDIGTLGLGRARLAEAAALRTVLPLRFFSGYEKHVRNSSGPNIARGLCNDYSPPLRLKARAITDLKVR